MRSVIVQVFEVLHYVGSCLLKMVRTKMRASKKPASTGDTGDPFLPCSNNNNYAGEGAGTQISKFKCILSNLV